MFLLLVYLAIALVISFLCSIAEAVLLSVNRSYIQALETRQPNAARRLRSFRDTPEEPLSAILTLNTIAHTVGAAGVGHQAAVVFGEQWLGLCSAVLTLLILVGSEIVPKTLGTTHWRGLAPIVGLGVHALTIVLYPIIRALRLITDQISHSTPAQRSRDEIESSVMLASESEHLSQAEADMLSNILTLRRIHVREIMTPRVIVFAVPEDMKIREFLEQHPAQRFSRIPLYRESIDTITGYVLRSALLEAEDGSQPLSSLRRDLPTLFETTAVSEAYSQLSEGDYHIAAVANEYGGTAGILALEDIIETIVGREIIDELDPAVDLREAAKEMNRLRVEGSRGAMREGHREIDDESEKLRRKRLHD
ncbi:MAG: CNNM domain-containing protein [Verrucomicrobiales bacterium]